MKVTDLLVSAILKKGILYEARMVDVEFDIPQNQSADTENSEFNSIKIHLTADHMSLKIEKENKEEA